MAELLEQIGRLDRRELVALIREAAARLETLEDEDDLSPEQRAQLDQVRDAYERDGNPGESGETVRARLTAQFETSEQRERIAA